MNPQTWRRSEGRRRCQDKQYWSTQRLAAAAAEALAWADPDRPTEPYRCPHCDLWHLRSKREKTA